MLSLKEMDNRGFEVERTSSEEIQIHPTVSQTEDACLPRHSDCPCLESQSDCSCGRVRQETSKVELQTWVKPKGVMLVVMSVALIAWCTIYFTLSALELL